MFNDLTNNVRGKRAFCQFFCEQARATEWNTHEQVDYFFFFSSRRRHTRSLCDWSSDVCSSDLSKRLGQSSDTLTIYGPRRIDRLSGPPATVTELFGLPSDAVPPFTIVVQNGDSDGSNQVSSATITLNGDRKSVV